MKRKIQGAKYAAFLLASSLTTYSHLEAQSNTAPINIVSTSTPFLRISPDARAGAMGDAGIALSPDGNATFWNAAKTPFAESQSQIGVTYTPWLKDIAQDVYLATIGGYYKISDEQAITGGVRYFNLGSIQFTTDGQTTWEGRPREFSIEGGYSQKITDVLSAGVTLRYINSNLAAGQQVGDDIIKTGTAFAGDISLFYNGLSDEGQGWTAGLTMSNLGTKIGYTNDPNSKEFLPANIGIGAAYTYAIDDLNKFTGTINLNHLLVPKLPAYTTDNPTAADSAQFKKDSLDYRTKSVFGGIGSSFGNKAYQASLGAEYGYNNQFFVRAGYYWETKEAGNRKYFSAGLGLKYNVFDISFSYLAPSGSGLMRNPLSNTLRFGIIFDLGNIASGE